MLPGSGTGFESLLMLFPTPALSVRLKSAAVYCGLLMKKDGSIEITGSINAEPPGPSAEANSCMLTTVPRETPGLPAAAVEYVAVLDASLDVPVTMAPASSENNSAKKYGLNKPPSAMWNSTREWVKLRSPTASST